MVEAPSSALADRLSSRNETLLQIVAIGVLGAVPFGYLVGRIATDRFLSAFTVSADEVGITQFTLVASALIAALIVALAGVALLVLAIAITQRFAQFVGTALLLLLLIRYFSLVGIMVTLLLAALWVVLESVTETDVGPSTRRAVATVFVLGVATAIVVLAVLQADRSAARVLNGQPVQVRLGPVAMRGIRAEPVLVRPIVDEPGLRTLSGRCVLFLGSSEGVVVLVDRGTVWRIPAQTVTLPSGPRHCSERPPSSATRTNGFSHVSIIKSVALVFPASTTFGRMSDPFISKMGDR